MDSETVPDTLQGGHRRAALVGELAQRKFTFLFGEVCAA
jgi:hypothetical protein